MSLKDKAQVSPAEIDILLLPFLQAAAKEDEELLLSRLFEEHINPVIRQILRLKMQWYFDPGQGGYRDPDMDEAYHEIQLHLLRRLLDFKRHPDDKSLTNLRSYVAASARNACDEYLRRKFPQRRKLKDKIRYCLTSRAGLALWKEGNRGWLSGLAEWEGAAQVAVDTQPLSVLMETLSVRLRNVAPERLEMDELLTTVFRIVGRPLELDQLTAAVAKLLGVEDAQATPFDEGTNSPSERVPNPQASPDTLLEQRQLLEELWREIQLLPRAQRVALLCNLRSPQGISVITLFPATQVATFEQLAEALEIPPEEFEVLWSRLPLDDLSIAEYLKISRQQVINLRRSARDRLQRRLKTLERETPH
jgi:RNA polymerase sigma factor (sigma-70 family)